MKNFNKKYLIVFFVIIIVFCSFIFFNKNKNVEIKENTQTQNIPENKKGIPIEKNSVNLKPVTQKSITPKISEPVVEKNTDTITLKINNTNINLPIQQGQTFYDILISAQKNGQINFTGKDYSGMGFFISSIGGLHEGDGRYLVYLINDTEASVGISSYIPKVGDIVEWKLSTKI